MFLHSPSINLPMQWMDLDLGNDHAIVHRSRETSQLITPGEWLNHPNSLLEWVGAGSPPGEEQSKANCLGNLCEDADADGLEGSLLCDDLAEVLRMVSVTDRGVLIMYKMAG